VAHFPECALSGYGPAAWPHWQGFDWAALDAALKRVCDIARSSGIWVVLGTTQRSGNGALPTNALLVIDRTGTLMGRYAKRSCSENDHRAFAPGARPLAFDIGGVRCGLLICLDWAFSEFWQQLAGQVELVFLSAASDRARCPRNQATTIPALMQGYASLHQFAISVANSSRPMQDFVSFWVERSGQLGGHVAKDRTGFVLNALADDAEQDRFFAMVGESRSRTRSR
jgi:predicted amidohydrolase